MPHWPRYGRIAGPIVMIGFGSIGKGTLPLIERHFEFDPQRFLVIDPNDADRKLLDERGVRFIHLGLTRENYRAELKKYLTAGEGQGFCVNLSVDTSSLDIMRYCRELGALYIDTVVEPWPGFYYDKSLGNEARTNYALRETVMEERRKNPGGPTAVSCCGANPGMVSWFVKQGLVHLAHDLSDNAPEPKTREEWGRLAQRLGVKGIHIAEAPQRIRQHLVDRGLPLRGNAASRTRLGHAREMDAPQRRFPQDRLARGDLPQPAGRQYPRALMDPDRAGAVRLPGHPQRVDLDRGLLHRARRQRRSRLPADLSLRLSSM
jgi:Saccharopine dehydrogenase NADP binding domain